MSAGPTREGLRTMDDKAVREEIISDLRDLGTDGWVCASAGADLIESLAADNERLRVAFDETDERASVTWYCKWVNEKRARETAERRCAELVALLRRVVEAHTGHNADGCDMRNAEIERITALTGDDRHAG